MAENLALRQQLFVVSRKRQKSPRLKTIDRVLLAFTAFFISKKRLAKLGIVVKPATILKFHRSLVKRKYSQLFTSKAKKKPGHKGFDKDKINLVLEAKKKNPSDGCPKIAMLVTNITGVSISEQTVRRILRKYFKSNPPDGPSWLSFIGNQVDSLCSIDLFRGESISLKSHWVMVVMDVYSRKIIGYSVQATVCTGPTVCRMFNEILSQAGAFPKRIVTDNDPLFNSSRWQANF